jgi:hypothetical protein
MNYYLRNRGGVSHEFGEMPRFLGGDSRIQAISLLVILNLFQNLISLSPGSFQNLKSPFRTGSVNVAQAISKIFLDEYGFLRHIY